MSNRSFEIECITYYNIPFVTVSFLVGILIIIGNAFVVLAVAKVRRLKTPTNVFVVNLAVADLLIGFQYSTVSLYNIIRCHFLSTSSETTYFVIVALRFGTVLLFPASAINLFAVSIERYLAVLKPFWYIQRVTVAKCAATTIAIWGIMTIVASSSFIDRLRPSYTDGTFFNRVSDVHTWLYGSLSGFVLLFTTVIYARIGRVILKHKKQIASTSFPSSHTATLMNRLKETKNTLLIFVILVCFYLSWIPILIITIIMTAWYKWDMYDIPYGVFVLNQIAELSLHSNSLCNPLIYAWMNTDFRETFWLMVNCNPW